MPAKINFNGKTTINLCNQLHVAVSCYSQLLVPCSIELQPRLVMPNGISIFMSSQDAYILYHGTQRNLMLVPIICSLAGK